MAMLRCTANSDDTEQVRFQLYKLPLTLAQIDDVIAGQPALFRVEDKDVNPLAKKVSARLVNLKKVDDRIKSESRPPWRGHVLHQRAKSA